MRRLIFLSCCLLASGGAGAVESIEVRIEGLQQEGLVENVRAFLSIVDRSEELREEDDEQDLTAAAVRRLHRQAPEEIRRALQPFGYYSPTVESSLEEAGAGWIASYDIRPGAPTKLQRVEIRVDGDARELPAVDALLADIEIETGETLSHADYGSAKRRLLETVYSAGYLDASFARSEIRVMPEQHVAEIYLILESGPRYYFGDIIIEQDILKPDFVRRYNLIAPGDPFDTNRLIDLQIALSSSEYFSSVDVQVERDNAEDFRIPVTVRTEPRNRQRYTTGVGYGTDTGPRISIGTEFRRINRRGHQFSSDLQLSEIRSTFTAQYHVPIENVATDRLTYFGSLQQAEIGDADTELLALGASREDGRGDLRRRIYLRFDRENFMFGDEPGGSATLVYPGLNLIYKSVDDPLYPRRGFSASFDVHGGVENLFSETSFVQSTFGARTVFPLGPRGRLLLRGEIGVIEAADFFALPPSQRFFTGGDRTVRGYGFQELSPVDAAGNDIGGRHFVAGSAEIDYLVKGNFGGAVFYDAGNAMNDIGGDLASSVGAGFRYRSPVGMIRVDFAHPLDDPDTSFRLHISLGPDL